MIVDGALLHYVVIHKITKKQVVVADPAKGIVKYTPEEFFKQWTGILILLVPSEQFEKGDETESTLSRFFKMLLPQKKLLFDIFFASLVYTILGVGASFYFKVMMDDIVPNGLEKTLHVVSVGVILLYLFQTLLGAFRSHMMLYLSQRLDISLILGYYHHVLKLPMNFFGSRKVGEIVSRFTDASRVRDAISGATLTIMIGYAYGDNRRHYSVYAEFVYVRNCIYHHSALCGDSFCVQQAAEKNQPQGYGG